MSSPVTVAACWSTIPRMAMPRWRSRQALSHGSFELARPSRRGQPVEGLQL